MQQRVDVDRGDVVMPEVLHLGLHPVRHLAELQRAGEAGAALERVQRTQHLVARLALLGALAPHAQRASELGHQLRGLFLEDREQVGVDRVEDVKPFVRIVECHVGWRLLAMTFFFNS